MHWSPHPHPCHPSWHAAGRRRGRGHGPPAPPFPPPPPGPPPPWSTWFSGPPPRAERGEVRWLVLHALSEQPRHGYQIIGAIEEQSGGAYRPSPGAVYPTLQLLEEMEQVRRCAGEEGGRKVYEITEAGRQEIEAHRDEIDEAYGRFRGESSWQSAEELHDLGRRLKRLMRSVGRGLRHGRLSHRKLQAIEKIIREAAERVEQQLEP